MDKKRTKQMDNPMFVDEETIPMVNQDEDYYDHHRTPDTSRIEDRNTIIKSKRPSKTVFKDQANP